MMTIEEKRELAQGIYDLVKVGRKLRQEAGIKPNEKPKFYIKPSARMLELLSKR